jgi:RNA polymerase sigma-70 factor (ECF subfamily)
VALRADDVDIARDRELVDRFQTGQVDAFEDLYARYYERLRRLCIRRVGDAHEAEEIAQEAFARAYVAFPNLGGPRHAYAWLSVVASRLCVDTHRRRARTQPAYEVERVEVAVDDDPLEAEVDLGHLRHALERLTPRHRDVLNLRETQGWSYQRIADHYGASLGTVEALLFRARHALRREFSAVAGGRRDLLALPGVGFLLRRLAALRERVEPWISAMAPTPYAELTTVFAFVASVGLVFGAVADGAPVHRPVALSATSDGAGFASLDDIPVVSESTPDGRSTSGSASAISPSPTPRQPSTEVATPETMDFAAARRNAENEPTHASTDHLTIGVNPDEAAEATENAADGYAEQAHDWIAARRLP